MQMAAEVPHAWGRVLALAAVPLLVRGGGGGVTIEFSTATIDPRSEPSLTYFIVYIDK